MSKTPIFHMAKATEPLDIIRAAQLSFVAGVKELIDDVRKKVEQPGLTWEQLDELINFMATKEPTVVFQQDEL